MYGPGFGEFVAVFAPQHALVFRNAGWSKAQVAEYLWRRATVPMMDRTGRAAGGAPEARAAPPVVATVAGLLLLVAGGNAGGLTCLIPPWGHGTGSKAVTKRVRAP